MVNGDACTVGELRLLRLLYFTHLRFRVVSTLDIKTEPATERGVRVTVVSGQSMKHERLNVLAIHSEQPTSISTHSK